MSVETATGEIKLGQSSGFRYLALIPPLTAEQLGNLENIGTPNEPGPTLFDHGLQRDGSQELAFHAEAFEVSDDPGVNERVFRDWSIMVAERIGGYTVTDSTVYHSGPGVTLFEQADGAEPEY